VSVPISGVWGMQSVPISGVWGMQSAKLQSLDEVGSCKAWLRFGLCSRMLLRVVLLPDCCWCMLVCRTISATTPQSGLCSSYATVVINILNALGTAELININNLVPDDTVSVVW
jgi:hypothetical protein